MRQKVKPEKIQKKCIIFKKSYTRSVLVFIDFQISGYMHFYSSCKGSTPDKTSSHYSLKTTTFLHNKGINFMPIEVNPTGGLGFAKEK